MMGSKPIQAFIRYIYSVFVYSAYFLTPQRAYGALSLMWSYSGRTMSIPAVCPRKARRKAMNDWSTVKSFPWLFARDRTCGLWFFNAATIDQFVVSACKAQRVPPNARNRKSLESESHFSRPPAVVYKNSLDNSSRVP